MTYFDNLFMFFIFVVQCYCKDNTIISKSVDEDVSFDCFHSKLLDTQNCSRIKWIKYSSNGLSSKVILAWPETPGFPNAKRIKWDPKDRQNVLLLTKVQKSDEGVFSCEIWSGWECVFTKNFTLKIKDCKSSVMKVLLGSSVALDCSVENKAKIYNYSWFMLKFGNPVLLPSKFVNGSTLTVRSALASDSGWYRCEYRLEDTQQRCVDINIQVQEPPEKVTTKMTQAPPDTPTAEVAHSDSGKSFSAGQTVGVSVGVVIISAALVVGAIFYWKHNKKVPEEPPEYDEFVEYAVVPYDVPHLDESTNHHSFQ